MKWCVQAGDWTRVLQASSVEVRTDESFALSPELTGQLGGDVRVSASFGPVVIPEGAYRVLWDAPRAILIQCSISDPAQVWSTYWDRACEIARSFRVDAKPEQITAIAFNYLRKIDVRARVPDGVAVVSPLVRVSGRTVYTDERTEQVFYHAAPALGEVYAYSSCTVNAQAAE